MNEKDIQKFTIDLKNHLSEWLESKDGAEYKYKDHIKQLPFLFDILNDMRLNKTFDDILSKKINNTVNYTVSHLDLLPEALMGPRGYIDDLYIVCLCFKDILKITSIDSIDISFINNIVSNGDTILGLNIKLQLDQIYNSY